VPLDIMVQLVVGMAAGLAVGHGGRWFIGRIRVQAGGLYSAVTLALAFLAFSVPSLLNGSGFLSVYIAGLVLGDGELPYRNSLFRVHDAAAWLSQIVLFMLLGLLVAPEELLVAGWAGVAIALFLTFIARPVVVALILLPFKYPPREVAYISWVGLRGAVPIVLATYPVLVMAPGAGRIFLVVFFIVVLSAILPGATVSWVARKLGLEKAELPAAPALLAIESRQHLTGDLLHFYVDHDVAVHDVTIEDLALPETAAVTVVVRGNTLVPAHPATTLLSGDHVYVIARPEDRGFIQLLFGRPEEE
jgi:cell volume regulation protein A